MIKEYSFRDKNYRVECAERIPQDPSWYSHEDEAEVRERDWNIAVDDVVIDIGSAYGSYALTALAAGASRVICFNPNKEENEFLRKSLALNGWHHQHRLFEEGLFSQSGWLHENGTFSESEVEGYFPVRSLDDIGIMLPQKSQIWMKIDVEGIEVEVLKGMKRFLKDFKPAILVENYQFKDETIMGRVEAVLESFGYTAASHEPYHEVVHSVYVRTE
jgi:FkbM family methyltransferase